MTIQVKTWAEPLHFESKSSFLYRVQMHSFRVWETKSHATSKVCPHLKAFLDFFAVFFMVPFQIKINRESNKYEIQTSKIRRVVVTIFQVINFVISSGVVYRSLETFLTKQRDIGAAFFVVSFVFASLSMFAIMKTFLVDADKILELFNQCSVHMDHPNCRRRYFLVFGICLIYAIVSIVLEYATANGEKEIQYIYNLLQRALSTVLDCSSKSSCHAESLSGPLYVIATVIIYYSFIAKNTQIPFMAAIALTLNTLANETFEKEIKESNTNISIALNSYVRMRRVTNSVAQLFGYVIPFYYICLLAYFAEMPQLVMHEGSDDLVIRICISLCMLTIWFTVYQAGKFNRKVEDILGSLIAFRRWECKINSDEHMILLSLEHELSVKPLGISCAYFTITTKFLSSTIGLIITYNLIVFQMTDREEKAFWNYGD